MNLTVLSVVWAMVMCLCTNIQRVSMPRSCEAQLGRKLPYTDVISGLITFKVNISQGQIPHSNIHLQVGTKIQFLG